MKQQNYMREIHPRSDTYLPNGQLHTRGHLGARQPLIATPGRALQCAAVLKPLEGLDLLVKWDRSRCLLHAILVGQS